MINFYKISLFIFLTLCTENLNAQQYQDSTLSSKKNRFTNFINYQNRLTHPKPQTAVKLSLLLPGAGQFYNRQGYKAVFIYGGFAAFLYAIDFNRSRYDIFADAYEKKVTGTATQDDLLTQFPENFLKARRDSYRQNLELSFLGLVGVYGLNVLDAFVSAHLADFDISSDLSLEASSTPVGPGVSLVYKF